MAKILRLLVLASVFTSLQSAQAFVVALNDHYPSLHNQISGAVDRHALTVEQADNFEAQCAHMQQREIEMLVRDCGIPSYRTLARLDHLSGQIANDVEHTTNK